MPINEMTFEPGQMHTKKQSILPYLIITLAVATILFHYFAENYYLACVPAHSCF